VSIRVELDDLPAEVAKRGPGYLLTTRDDGRPHAIEVSFSMADGALVAPSGRTTGRNIAAQPLVAIVFPPIDDGGYSLIIDGEATINDGGSSDGASTGEGDAPTAHITPTSALLHRPAATPG